MTNIFFKKREFEHRHIQGEDDVKIQRKDSRPSTSQGERLGKDPSLATLRRKKTCRHFDLGLLVSRTVRQ